MRRRLLLGAVVAGAVLLPAVAAWAHPLGNFTVNRFSRIVVVPGHVRVDYVVDMAEIPTFQTMPAIDIDHDGAGSPQELAAWAAAQAPGIAAHLDLRIGGSAVTIRPGATAAQVLPGQGGLQTLRFEGTFGGSAPASGRLSFRDMNFADRIGWREIVAVGADGAQLRGSSAPTTSVSDELRAYPRDLLSSPLAVASMTASFAPGASARAPGPITSDTTTAAVRATTSRPLVEGGPFAGVLSNHGFALVALGVAIAVGFGAWHALLPGHGKTLMAAYMVGSTSRTRHAVAVGSAVAGMHTASVTALGLLVLTLEQTFRPEALYPWLGLLSGLAALALGAFLLASRLRSWRIGRSDEGHEHGEGHDHDHGHGHGPGGHTHALPEGAPLSPRGIMALAFAGGILPAPSALLVMLGAIEAHRIAYGLTLVLSFSAGLAVALIVVGMGALRAREAVARRLSTSAGRLIPILSATAIVGVGLFLTLRGVTQV